MLFGTPKGITKCGLGGSSFSHHAMWPQFHQVIRSPHYVVLLQKDYHCYVVLNSFKKYSPCHVVLLYRNNHVVQFCFKEITTLCGHHAMWPQHFNKVHHAMWFLLQKIKSVLRSCKATNLQKKEKKRDMSHMTHDRSLQGSDIQSILASHDKHKHQAP